MKRKLIAILLVVVMVIGVNGIGLAATFTEDSGSGTSTLNKTVAQTYTLTIPAGPTTIETEGTTSTVSIDDAYIPYGKVINVAITASVNHTEGKFYLKNNASGANDIAEYTIKKGETPISLSDTIFSVAAGDLTGSETLTYALVVSPKMANTYTDTLTFTATVANPTP